MAKVRRSVMVKYAMIK